MTSPVRGSDVFLKEDVRSILSGILAANELAAKYSGMDPAYRAGFVAAMIAVSAAMAIQLPEPERGIDI